MIDIATAQNALLAAMRQRFWTYLRVRSPEFYKKDRLFLKDFAEKLQWFVEESTARVMVVNMPPRHGKSRTASEFVEWLFGKYGTDLKVMTGSYNETLSETFAKTVRDTIAEEGVDDTLVYSDIFPDIKIKYGEASVKKWALDGSRQANYLATSPGGTATGFGCNIMIIDDLIKNAEEAFNPTHLQKLISWYTDTMLQRTEAGYKVIIIMTRWALEDLAGFLLDNEEDVVHITYKALQEDGTMLCEEILPKEEYLAKTKNMTKEIVEAIYQQEPMDLKGRLYTHFKTYTDIPRDDNGEPLFKYILNYTDTADTGADSLTSICYGVYDGGYYILDVLHTAEPMEVTEPATAAMLKRNNVGCAHIESNNGGRGFARAVERISREQGNAHTVFHWFHQSKNKQARILSNSASVMNNVYMPVDWVTRWPDFAKALLKYQKAGKNEHDDAPDALTGVYENPEPKGRVKVKTFKGGI